MTSETVAAPATVRSRISAVDALRGLVMIIMALDHTRDFFSREAALFVPEDLTQSNAAIFLTRWITHFCAPVFMFTAGIGAALQLQRGRSKSEISRFLWTRGLWLVLLEVTVFRLILSFSIFGGPVILLVLWALGCSMIALAALIYLPVSVLTILSIAMIALHNLVDKVPSSTFGSGGWLWKILHEQGVFGSNGLLFFVAYPILPWIFVMAAGYCFGELYRLDAAARRKKMLQLGSALTVAFVIIRGLNIYGDPRPWTTAIPGMTVLSFLNCTKYPPSLDFLLMTLGPAILVLAWMDGKEWTVKNPLIVFGRTPLFFFLVHFFVIHVLMIVLSMARYGYGPFLWLPPPAMGGPPKLFPAAYGWSVASVYLIWAFVAATMYPVCLWFSRVKAQRDSFWLRYL